MGDVAAVDAVLARMRDAYGVEDNAALAFQLEIEPTTFRVWRSRGRVPVGVVAKVSEQTARQVAWLKDGGGEKAAGPPGVHEPPPKKFGAREKQVKLLSPAEPDDDFVTVLPYSPLEGSRATRDALGRMSFSRDWLARKGLDSTSLGMVTQRGDSMQPTIWGGDMMLVDLHVRVVTEDGIHLIDREGGFVCRRVQRLHHGGLMLVSDNQQYKPEELSAIEAQRVRLAGRVVWSGGER